MSDEIMTDNIVTMWGFASPSTSARAGGAISGVYQLTVLPLAEVRGGFVSRDMPLVLLYENQDVFHTRAEAIAALLQERQRVLWMAQGTVDSLAREIEAIRRKFQEQEQENPSNAKQRR